jgi:dTDP-4-dehydrorhamnose 3,5-epimerase
VDLQPLKFPGVYLVLPVVRGDERGHFVRTWDEAIFRRFGLARPWVQENQSYNRRQGILRGLHFQRPPHAETKLIRVAQGAVLDVFVDLRRGSPSFGQWDAVELSADNQRSLFLPKGFAHGYCTLTPESLVQYKVDACYAPDAEGGLRWDDPALAIAWPVREPQLSPKDAKWPSLADFDSPFIFEDAPRPVAAGA